ncbi:hypothetical protein KC901_02280 [Patescibacteria group bacterium]|nr:hypothetical protein [Patescibacteria group bacterium]
MKKFYAAFILVIVGALSPVFFQSASALTASPAKLEIAGDPGTTLTGTIELYNEKLRNQTVYTSFENFESNDDTGTPRFVGADDGLATWMNAPASISLSAQERTEVTYTISIPASAEPGGYFAALFFGNQPPQPNGSVITLGGRLGVLVLLRVNGDVPESGGILDFASSDQKKFYINPPIEFTYRFSNTGGDRVVPKGAIELRNTFGFVRDSLDANPKDGSVLPNTARKFTNMWEQRGETPQGFFATARSQWHQFHFGWYTAHLRLYWGQSGQESVADYSFFIFPWQILLLSLIVLLLVWMILKFAGRAYKRSIIREIEKQQETQKKQPIKKPAQKKKIKTDSDRKK